MRTNLLVAAFFSVLIALALAVGGCSSVPAGVGDASPLVCGCPDAAFDPSPLLQRIAQLEDVVGKLSMVTNRRVPHLVDTAIGEDLGLYLEADCSYSSMVDGELCHAASPNYEFPSTDCTGPYYADMAPYRAGINFISATNTITHSSGIVENVFVRSEWTNQFMTCTPAMTLKSSTSPMVDTGIMSPRRLHSKLAIQLQ